MAASGIAGLAAQRGGSGRETGVGSEVVDKQKRAVFDILGRGLFMIKNDQSFWRRRPAHVNATSTRIRRFGAVSVAENRLMSVVVGMEHARNQRLGA